MLLSGCWSPEIANEKWKYIRVVYLVRDEDNGLKPQSWHSEDKGVLERLQATFPSDGEYITSTHKIFGSRINRIDIRLRGGQWWSLTYSRNNEIAIQAPLGIKGTFALKHSNPKVFFVTLTNEIMSVSETAVDLHTVFRPGEADVLGDNDAWGYERNFW